MTSIEWGIKNESNGVALSLKEIRAAIDAGQTVHFGNPAKSVTRMGDSDNPQNLAIVVSATGELDIGPRGELYILRDDYVEYMKEGSWNFYPCDPCEHKE